MLNLRNQTIFVALQSVDMRKSFDSLAALVKNSFSKNPLDGAYFVFINKSADRIKILYWDTDGYALWYKRLEQGRFRLPAAVVEDGKATIPLTAAQLAMLLEGIEPLAVKHVNGNQYVYIGNEDEPYHVFDFQINQSAKGMLAFLDGYQNFVQCDAHGNYDALFQPKMVDLTKPPPQEVGCHAHCRRKFTEAEKYEPDDSKRILNLYKKLYKIEAEVKDCPFAERMFRRQEESVPLLNELFDACREIQSAELFLPKSPLGQAVAYALKNETALRRYCTKSFLNIDNNVSERTLRAFVVGRKNWLFFGSEQAAKNSAVVMSVLSSARRHGLNEWEYLVDILYRLSDLNSESEWESLLPDRWVKSVGAPTEAAPLIAGVAAVKSVEA
ncbi:hypothetical protein FACS189443_0340 [Planctomycetales bacterium]|nr:hypothetical protein FACS189443_0340 [Planctomycetales bacterium]